MVQFIQLIFYHIQKPFNTFANRAEPDQAALLAYEYMIRYDSTLADKFIYIIIHRGRSLAWILMKKRVKIRIMLYLTAVAEIGRMKMKTSFF